MKLSLDVDALTFGDMEDFEATTGSELMATFGKIGADGDMSAIKAKDMVALVWICGRAANPEFTLDEARKIRLADLEFEEPTPDPSDGSGTSS